ncbi:hypothetical protein EVAR_31080_1 [Eumeta japonica]|uniref:Phorbol-ester/DAG-type domain-containing protein n=1 Tax=Eumeta variegata TaxID=151549 RepID=A0A4C1XFK3_EUMVA|nr:hypothetical protein EVAR_31080_1 [Eumeta japonica]
MKKSWKKITLSLKTFTIWMRLESPLSRNQTALLPERELVEALTSEESVTRENSAPRERSPLLSASAKDPLAFTSETSSRENSPEMVPKKRPSLYTESNIVALPPYPPASDSLDSKTGVSEKLPIPPDHMRPPLQQSYSNRPSTSKFQDFSPEAVCPFPKAAPRKLTNRGPKGKVKGKKTKPKATKDKENANNIIEEKNEEQERFCLVCGEPYSKSKPNEMWIPCGQCRFWAHEECTPQEFI